MGRGRAKAKQVKVARRLKYNSGGTDLDRLKEELGVADSGDDSYDDLSDKYSDYADEYGDEGDHQDGSPGR
ncbi:DUF3073 domain-containing protein [Actinomadura craniellae]|uniref:DUF3073 domain-containing protein n=1 Tax=Actinomadura craniellae TaxID=2231787 RepID=A0A365H3F9_9ACTN|nr:DUF3073 domain-containing protein [Actinomadura craniellae]RAY13644.1 DUF3073 domain-containing protein [Actinomadura craniellae]